MPSAFHLQHAIRHHRWGTVAGCLLAAIVLGMLAGLLALPIRGQDLRRDPLVLITPGVAPSQPRQLEDPNATGRLRVLREGGLHADAQMLQRFFRRELSALPPIQAARRSSAGFRGQRSASRPMAAASLAPVTLHLLPDTSFTILPQGVVDRNENSSSPQDPETPRGRSVHGVLIAGGEGVAVLSEYGGFVAGSIRLQNGEFYEFDLQPVPDADGAVDGIRPARGIVRQLEYDGLPPGTNDVVLPEDDDERLPDATTVGANKASSPSLLESAYTRFTESEGVITVAAYYTQRVLDARGGQNGWFAFLGRLEEESNAALRNSQINLEYRFVSTSLVDFDDTRSDMSYSQALTRLASVYDAHPRPRSRLAALFVNPPLPGSGRFTVGIAYLRRPFSGPERHSVTHQLYAGGLSLTFAHEAGHNFGCVHDVDNGGGSGGLFGDSRGYQQRNNEPKFYTVMAYSCSGCRAVPYYSEPQVLYESLPVGTSATRCAATIVREASDDSWMGAPPNAGCPIELLPASLSLSSEAQDLQVELRIPSGCQWQVEPAEQPGFVEALDTDLPRQGPGWLRLRVNRNPSSEQREQVLSIRGLPLRIRQQPASAGSISSSHELLKFSASNLPDSSQERCLQLAYSHGAVEATVDIDAAHTWISVDRQVAALPGFLCVRVSPRGVANGNHRVIVRVRSSTDPPVERLISVELRISSNVTRLLYSPRALAFETPLESPISSSQWLEVAGPGGLEFHPLSGPPSWLRLQMVENAEGTRATVWADATGMAAGVYEGRLLIQCSDDSCAPRVVPVRLEVKASPANGPRIAPGGIVNAASFSQGLSVGSWMSIFGEQLAPGTRGWRAEDFFSEILPLNLDGVRVRVAGVAASVSFISPGQVNFQCPNVTTTGWVPVELITPNGSTVHHAYLEAESPGVFLLGDTDNVAALHEDATPAAIEGSLGADTVVRAARPGDVLSIYGTGFGVTVPRVPTGEIYQGAARIPSNAHTRVFIGGLRAQLLFAGQSGAGLNQLNVLVPNLPPGEHAVRVVIGASPSPWRGVLRIE